jgi:hypothetical protein
MWENTICELALPCNATIDGCVKLCLADRQGTRAKERSVATVRPRMGTVLMNGCRQLNIIHQ